MSFERAATRIYVLALRAFPRSHRGAYAAEMIDTFERELAARMRGRGRSAGVVFVVAASLNIVSAGLGERLRRVGGVTAATGFSWLDVILAWGVLVRYPGLTVVGVFGMTVGIAIATGAFTIVSALLDPVLPLPEPDRIVALVNRDAATNNREQRVMLDFAAWRELASVEEIAASHNVSRNLIAAGGQPETVAVAEITAAAFQIARVSPLMGRYLLPEDERPGAPGAIVIGHDVWVRRFSSDPDIVGRAIQLGATTYAIVGVMPPGFAFPINHSFWVPWRMNPLEYQPRSGPLMSVFGRLAPGATLESAQSELAAMGQRMAAASPATHQHLRPNVLPFTYGFSGLDDPDNALALHAIQLAIVMLLIVVCVNVAILVYARTATRQGEIAVRSALGASRRRIVAQLFVEALVMAAVAAGIGLGLLSFAFTQLDAALVTLAGRLPFWITFRLSTDDVVYAVVLTVFASIIVGVVPALKATGRGVQTRLQGLSAGSGSRMQMGRLWTTLIVAQVALTVALLPATVFHAWNSLRTRTGDRGFASQNFLTTQLVLDRQSDGPPDPAAEQEFRRRYARQQNEVEARLETESTVTGVTFSMTNVGEEWALVLEVEGVPPPADPINYNIVEGSKRGHLVRFNRVALDFFEAFEVPILVGRGFDAGDLGAVDAVVVNRTMADDLFGGGNPLGRRIRYVGRSREANAGDVALNKWYEIVGVVPDFPAHNGIDVERVRRLYHPAAPGDVYPPTLSVRVRGSNPVDFTSRLREISAAVDPNLQLRNVSSFKTAAEREQGLMRLIGLTLGVAMLSVVVLSAAGIYALMSFTVARRRREIGIRVALGADRARILGGIFSRAFAQLMIGALAGMLGAVGLEQVLEGEMFQGHGAVILPIVAVFMTTVGLLAALGPARRGLSIQPTEALREE
jgi:predicted permease